MPGADPSMLVLGALVTAAVAFAAGTSGYGFGLLATPVLLLIGFSLPFVVTVNLLVALATRLSVAYRFRRHIRRRRTALLVVGCIPGLLLGAYVLTAVDERPIHAAAGLAVMVASLLLALTSVRPARAGWRAAPLAAGFAGGFLGTTTSLIGGPPALLLARERLAATGFFADMALYFVVASAIGLATLGAAGEFRAAALFPAFVLWLPGVLAGNLAGTHVGVRLSERPFRLLTLLVAFVAGAVTAATA
jgi:uncharacterized protein